MGSLICLKLLMVAQSAVAHRAQRRFPIRRAGRFCGCPRRKATASGCCLVDVLLGILDMLDRPKD